MCTNSSHPKFGTVRKGERERPQLKTRKRSLGTDEPTPTAGEFTKEVLQTVYQAPPRSQPRGSHELTVPNVETYI